MSRTTFGLLALLALTAPARAADEPGPMVGVVARLEQLVLPGPELEPKPLDDRMAKVVLRVVDVFPHGTAFRYNLSYYGLEPGTYDLRDSLRRKDGSSAADLPPIPVTVRAALPPGQIEPSPLTPTPSSFRGYYRPLMFLGAVLWFLGLLAILFVGRKKARAAAEAVKPATTADRLRPLVARAMAGTIGPGERAELERTLIDYWRRRLGLQNLAPAHAIARIKVDPEAGALLRQLESWLHRPPGEAGPFDLAALLGPYEHAADPEPIPEPEAATR